MRSKHRRNQAIHPYWCQLVVQGLWYYVNRREHALGDLGEASQILEEGDQVLWWCIRVPVGCAEKLGGKICWVSWADV